MSAKPVVLNINEWNTSEIKYLPPKVNDKGGKTINIISKQNNRSLSISTPLLMTWGISDFVNDQGESDNKFSLSLTFPNEDYKNANTDLFLKKLVEFESQVIDDATANSELWFGSDLPREVVKHMFFPILKYSKNKDTKKIDYSRPPSIRAKVPNYGGKWNVEIYDTKMNLIFPCENENITPMDLVPKMSSVACVLNFGTIWVGGSKSFGVQLKLIQAVVKPRLVESVYGKCHIQLSSEEKQALDNQDLSKVPVQVQCQDEEETLAVDAVKRPITEVDSDDDLPPLQPSNITSDIHYEVQIAPPVPPAPSVSSVSSPMPVVSSEPVLKKKIVKKPKV